MTNDAAFLRAVIDHPDADAPRLVYADWLDERGDPRGEFIRVQCELAGLRASKVAACSRRRCLGHALPDAEAGEGACKSCRGIQTKRDALRARERELLRAHWWEWLPSVIPGPTRCLNVQSEVGDHAFAVEFRRGFVEAVTCSAADWLGGPCPRQWVSMRVHPSDCECKSTGRLPGHAAALLAATPLRHVKFITAPDDEVMFRLAGKHGLHLTPPQVLAAEFPGLTFELPASTQGRFTEGIVVDATFDSRR